MPLITKPLFTSMMYSTPPPYNTLKQYNKIMKKYKKLEIYGKNVTN
ncbi:hypothetical protein [Helicobacter rappini]|uniref:Uncharacterized protein n=1 Tax=Helicobacter bilis ATCC 43879 TaxID=613026 RepID=T5LPY6_9HELI|nr:hypothetical protein [Helicobacter rappini]EQM94732.1 hypothetical protein HRAG_02466 [Helicobacter bilis ATCC 43879]